MKQFVDLKKLFTTDSAIRNKTKSSENSSVLKSAACLSHDSTIKHSQISSIVSRKKNIIVESAMKKNTFYFVDCLVLFWNFIRDNIAYAHTSNIESLE
jgi:hypothetical protein